METLKNPQPIKEFVALIPEVQKRLTTVTEEMQWYLEYLKDERYEEKENETKEDALKRAESLLDRIIDIGKRRQEVKGKSEETLLMIEELKKRIEVITESCSKDEDNICDAHNGTIDKIIEIREEIMKEKIQPHQTKIDEYRRDFEENKAILLKNKSELNEAKRLRLEKERKEREERERIERESRDQEKIAKMLLNEAEANQLEEWTSLKCGEVVFDSNKDDWSLNTSVFGDKVMNKSNLIIVIEDTNGNQFGGYVSVTINKYDFFHKDSNAFIFSLKSNGRINGMKKFTISKLSEAFEMWNKNNYELFRFGWEDFVICKNNHKTDNITYCKQSSFNYQGIKTGLCGPNTSKTQFTTKRIVVIK